MTFGVGVYGTQIYGVTTLSFGGSSAPDVLPLVIERSLRPMGEFGPVDMIQRTIQVNQPLITKLQFLDKNKKTIIPPEFNINKITADYTLQSDRITENNIVKLQIYITLHSKNYVFLDFLEIDDYGILFRLFAR